MKSLLAIVGLFTYTMILQAQTHMRIHHYGGSFYDVPIEQIDSVTFVKGGDESDDEVSLTGCWLWGDAEAGYYELLTFNEDKNYTCYDKYFTYGFDSMTYGWYAQLGSILTLQSNGFGYNKRYNWFLMGLTENVLDVMTKMGRFTYYKLQQDVIYLQLSGESLECNEGESFIFADGVVANVVDGKIQGLTRGTTYILKYISRTNTIVAYKIVVE